MNPQKQSAFFSVLPPEIRNQIYEYCLLFSLRKFSRPLFPEYEFLVDTRSGQPPWAKVPRFMRACKRLYHEANPMAVTRVAVAFSRTPRRERTMCMECHGKLVWERLEHLSVVVMLPEPSCALWVPFLQALLIRMPKIKTLELVWHGRWIQIVDTPNGRTLGLLVRQLDHLFMNQLVRTLAEKKHLRRVRFRGEEKEVAYWLDQLQERSEIRVTYDTSPLVPVASTGGTLCSLRQKISWSRGAKTRRHEGCCTIL